MIKNSSLALCNAEKFCQNEGLLISEVGTNIGKLILLLEGKIQVVTEFIKLQGKLPVHSSVPIALDFVYSRYKRLYADKENSGFDKTKYAAEGAALEGKKY